MKATVYTVCDEISKLVPRLYWSYLTGMPLEDAIMKRKFYGTWLLSWALSTEQHLVEATRAFGIHGKTCLVPGVRILIKLHLNGC